MRRRERRRRLERVLHLEFGEKRQVGAMNRVSFVSGGGRVCVLHAQGELVDIAHGGRRNVERRQGGPCMGKEGR